MEPTPSPSKTPRQHHDTVVNTKLKVERNPYLEQHRLHDVIRLITVLSVTKNSFRTEEGMKTELRDGARSADTWLLVAYNHPEFFRLSWDQNRFILLQRYLKQPGAEVKDDQRKPLTDEQTEKLILQAYTLYDKALAMRQRKSFLWPFYGAVVAAFASIFVAIHNDTDKKQLDSITRKLDSVFTVIKTIKTDHH